MATQVPSPISIVTKRKYEIFALTLRIDTFVKKIQGRSNSACRQRAAGRRPSRVQETEDCATQTAMPWRALTRESGDCRVEEGRSDNSHGPRERETVSAIYVFSICPVFLRVLYVQPTAMLLAMNAQMETGRTS